MDDVIKVNRILKKWGLYNFKIMTSKDHKKFYYILFMINDRTKRYLGDSYEIPALFNGICMYFHGNPEAQQVVEVAKEEYCRITSMR